MGGAGNLIAEFIDSIEINDIARIKNDFIRIKNKMIKNKNILCLIPARSKSKGLPNKNIKKLNSIPLVGISIQTALKSKYIDDVILSTDQKK